MPIIIDPTNVDEPVGVEAIRVRRRSLEPQTRGAEFRRGSGEAFLYVIAGSGSARVADREFPLAPESVLWLEVGDVCSLLAGPQGLEILEARAR